MDTKKRQGSKKNLTAGHSNSTPSLSDLNASSVTVSALRHSPQVKKFRTSRRGEYPGAYGERSRSDIGERQAAVLTALSTAMSTSQASAGAVNIKNLQRVDSINIMDLSLEGSYGDDITPQQEHQKYLEKVS
tara:strand:+ start:371 stop:766 length:396 start_codon:yes stop_codon:yes gene_type:complete